MLAFIFVDHLPETYRALTFRQLAVPILLGAGWGIAQILFGVSVKRLGLGIAYAIIVGLGAVFGTLVPLFVQQRALAQEHALILILSGVVVMSVGIFLTAWSGQIKERAAAIHESASHRSYLAAILLAVLCGLMAPMLNYSFAFGQDIAKSAVVLGNQPAHAAYAVWPIALAGGLIPNVAYSLWLLVKNRTWSLFRSTPPDLLRSSLMGVLWMGAFALYGMSATYLGALGTSVGWGYTKAQFKSGFPIFLQAIRALPGRGKLIWTTITPVKPEASNGATNPRIDARNAIAPAFIESEKILVDDQHALMTQHADLYEDAFHFNNAGSAIMGGQAAAIIKNALESSRPGRRGQPVVDHP